FDRCNENAETAGLGAPVRLTQADSYACFVHYIAHEKAADMATNVNIYSGAGIKEIVQGWPRGEIDLNGPDPRKPIFAIKDVLPNSVVKFRWLLKDDAGKNYLMTDRSGETIPLDYGDVYVTIIPAKTRALLRSRNVTSGEVHC